MKEDQEGFGFPEVNVEKCIGCGLCEKVCPILRKKDFYIQSKEKAPIAVGGWHKDEKIRLDSSSGGAFSLFAEYVLGKGGIVYGCTMTETLRAEHIGIERVEDLQKLRGSKYLQSNIGTVYQDIQRMLGNNRKVLFIGTPCQCAGLHSFLQEAIPPTLYKTQYENLYICDFICHGVPSPKVFDSYIHFLEEEYQDKIVSFRFRNKDKGWKPSGLQMGTNVEFLHKTNKRFAPAFKDAFMNGFLDDVYLRLSCYQCEFKQLPKYYADLTIADFWGVKRVAPELHDGKGTSLILFHSEKGRQLFEKVKDNFQGKEVDFQAAIRKNKSLIRSAAWNPRRDRFFYDYNNKGFQKTWKKYMTAFSWAFHKIMKIAWNCIEKLIKLFLNPVLKFLHQDWNEAQWEDFLQFIKFAVVGASNVAVSYTINICTLFSLRNIGLKFDYIIANLTAFVLSVLWSYHWNSTYVFHPDRKEKGWRVKTLVRTYISYAVTGLVLNNVLATIWIHGLGISKYLSPLLNLPFSIPTNFFMHKLWAYKERKK
ncbi:MAG: Coenzyme F420 hydrogenase/dehydrogenase, beta subunit C-terminal domain [Blautia sp.]|nr:Coenzyme F420 hydrogenase/dehydrogenase, beta subunit C-terminal domain [Blautia sp.]